jgi:hypothetical protein
LEAIPFGAFFSLFKRIIGVWRSSSPRWSKPQNNSNICPNCLGTTMKFRIVSGLQMLWLMRFPELTSLITMTFISYLPQAWCFLMNYGKNYLQTDCS